MNASVMGTLIIYVAVPTAAILELTASGRRLLDVIHGVREAIELVVLRITNWVDHKAEDLFEDFELSHIILDIVHHGFLTHGAGH